MTSFYFFTELNVVDGTPVAIRKASVVPTLLKPGKGR